MALTAGEVALLGSAFVLGLRHGVDYDHIAAISDIASLQRSPLRGTLLGGFYAAGHGMVVMALGAAAVALNFKASQGLDAVMGRAVGLTLVALALFVLYSLVRNRGSSQRLPSRGLLLLQLLLSLPRLLGRFQRKRPNLSLVRAPDKPLSWVAVGVIHGIGAETPTQLVLFVLAAGLTGPSTGILVVAAFVAGVLATNALMGTVLAFGCGSLLRRPWLYRSMIAASAVYSLVVGVMFTGGIESWLPGPL